MSTNYTFEEKQKAIFATLFNAEWDGQKIWEHIHDERLTATPAFEGKFYKNAQTKIMFVGRDLNGWDEAIGDCSTLSNTVNSIICQSGALDTLVNKDGYGTGPRKYYHKNSKFFRFIKLVLEKVGESDTGIDETWYNDSREWNQRFVWANLYCISPRRPNSSKDAHPNNAMVKLGISEYVDLMELYINHYKPDVVVFITDIPGWFVRWTKQRSFKDFVSNYQEISTSGPVVATGNVNSSKIIVCQRPDKRNTSYATVEAMAQIVSEWIMAK